MAAETATAMERATLTARITTVTPKPTTAIDDSDEDETPGMCLVASDRTVASAFSGGDGDGEKNDLTEKKIYSTAAARPTHRPPLLLPPSPPPLLSPYFQLSP